MKRLVTYGIRFSDNKPIMGSLIKIPDRNMGTMRYFIKQDNSEPGADEVYPGSVYDEIVEICSDSIPAPAGEQGESK